jgi:hypothetical protein
LWALRAGHGVVAVPPGWLASGPLEPRYGSAPTGLVAFSGFERDLWIVGGAVDKSVLPRLLWAAVSVGAGTLVIGGPTAA